jgi:hypothetical protein
MNRKYFVLMLLVTFFSCNSESHIRRLISSDNVCDRILGIMKAGNSGDLKYVPQIFEVSYDPSGSTDIRFYGRTVHEQCMYALQELLHIHCPNKIDMAVDSANVTFFKNYWKRLRTPKLSLSKHAYHGLSK